LAPSASEAFASGGEGESTIGWKIRRAQRRALLTLFPPKYPNTIADHVTLRGKASPDAPLPRENEGEVIGRADDGRGVEALAVRIAGTSDRPGGGTYHITWSLEDGREARESNDVLADSGWVELEEPVPIELSPARWP